MKKNTHAKFGFTLAEVLITLTIIGVISAITLPNLQTNVNKNALEKQTLKFISSLQDMVERYKVDNSTDTVDKDMYTKNNINKYFKVMLECTSRDDCFGKSYTSISGTTLKMTDLFEENAKYYKLQDGSAFAAKTDGGNFVVFDVNGPKKPNKNGQDLWVVKIKDDGTVDDVEVSNTSTISTINTKYTNCKNGTKVHGCIGKFLRNGFKIED